MTLTLWYGPSPLLMFGGTAVIIIAAAILAVIASPHNPIGLCVVPAGIMALAFGGFMFFAFVEPIRMDGLYDKLENHYSVSDVLNADTGDRPDMICDGNLHSVAVTFMDDYGNTKDGRLDIGPKVNGGCNVGLLVDTENGTIPYSPYDE